MQAVHELKQNKLRLKERKTFLEEFKLGIITKDEYRAAITGLEKEAERAASPAWDIENEDAELEASDDTDYVGVIVFLWFLLSPSLHQLTYVSLF
jgi:hypothetical protein